MNQDVYDGMTGERVNDEVDWQARYRELEDQMAEMVSFLSKQRASVVNVGEQRSPAMGPVKIESVDTSSEGSSIQMTVVAAGADLEYALYEYSGDKRISSWNYRRSNSFEIDMSRGSVDRVRIFVRMRSKPESMDTRSLNLIGAKK
ncbi:hypothetical protein QFE97_02900 [Bacillus subtilis]|nr:hypothetical protein QFE97_02900 [Bacillus subtilis]